MSEEFTATMAASGSLCVDDYVDDIVAKKGRHVYKEGLSEKDWRKVS